MTPSVTVQRERGTSQQELDATNTDTGQTVTLDTISFHPFTSDTILFTGQQFGSGVPNPGGLLTLATDLYTNGYDVYIYVLTNNGLAEAFDEIVQAVDTRAVTQLAIMGHSHGGGATFLLANRVMSGIRTGKITGLATRA